MRALAALLSLVIIASLAAAQAGSPRVKRPVCPGRFFPAQADQLRAAVQQYLNEAAVTPRDGRLVAVIAPTGLYSYSGRVAAHAFKPLQAGQYDRVILLTPTNFANFRGSSIPAVEYLITPLNPVRIDVALVDTLIWSPLIDRRGLRYAPPGKRSMRAELHEREYGDEVNLPFLQETLRQFVLVPLIVGDYLTSAGKTDFDAITATAKAIRDILDDRTLLVVSTDFTRYGKKFEFMPFRDNVVENIRSLDDEAFNYVINRDVAGFAAYLKETGNPINGAVSLMILMEVLRPGVEGYLLDYANSATIRNDTSSSVSYAAMAFYDPALSPAEIRPLSKPDTERHASSEPEAQDVAAPLAPE